MKADTIVYPVAKDDLPFVEGAARWMSATYAGRSARERGCTVELTGPPGDRDLIRIWLTSLANERLVETARPGRARVLEDLLK